MQGLVVQMADMDDAAVGVDDDVLRRDAQVELPAQCAVINDDRHRQAILRAEGAHGGLGFAVAGVDRHHRDALALLLMDLLEARRLLSARYAPRGPELQIHRPLAVQRGQVDALAVDAGQRRGGAGLADQLLADALDALLAVGAVIVGRR